MDKAYWNKIGSGYNQEIFDVYAEDREGKLKKYLRKYANKDHFAIDFGCGTGKALPHLAPAFRKVLGLDISEALLRQARQMNFLNTEFQRMDLAQPGKLPKADFAFCCNVAILPDMKKNTGIFKNIHRSLKVNGSAVVVIPSVESTLFAGKRIVEAYAREGVSFAKIPKEELDYYNITKKELLQGFFKIAGVPTKHYSEPELRAIFEETGLTIKKIDKIEYNWTTEFVSPPKWLRAPYPWDWIVDCTRIK